MISDGRGPGFGKRVLAAIAGEWGPDERAEKLAGYIDRIRPDYPDSVGLAVAAWLGYSPHHSELGVQVCEFVDEQCRDPEVASWVIVTRLANRFPELEMRP